MKTFGIDFSNSKLYNVQDIAARLFLTLGMIPSKIPKLIERLENGAITFLSFKTTTNKQIEQLLSQQDAGQMFATKMAERVQAWEAEFGPLSKNDYAYLKDTFGLKAEVFPTNKYDVHCPNDMANYVKQFVKGQDQAIDKLSVLFYLQQCCLKESIPNKMTVPVLLMGDTGVGKSETFRRFAEICDCPFIRINSSEVSPESWQGTQLFALLNAKLAKIADKRKAKYAIVVFHEFDKITHPKGTLVGNEMSHKFDMDLMREFMRLFEEGHPISVNKTSIFSSGNSEFSEIDIDNFLIVFDGAFSGIENLIARRLNVSNAVGYGKSNQVAANSYLKEKVCQEDLIAWGYLPELVGRIGDIIVMNRLNTQAMVDIMKTGKENILQEHIHFCSQRNIPITFEDNALTYIAQKAVASGLGFRYVKTALFKVMSQFYNHALNQGPQSTPKSITEANVLAILNKTTVQTNSKN